jgi:hypothetical protein
MGIYNIPSIGFDLDDNLKAQKYDIGQKDFHKGIKRKDFPTCWTVWDDRLWYNCTNLTNDYSHQRSSTEIDMSHSDRKWNYRAHAESVAAYAQKQRQQKTNKDKRYMKGYK